MINRSDQDVQECELLTVRVISGLIGRPLRSTYRWLHRNSDLPIQRIGRRIFVCKQDLVTFLARQRRGENSEAVSPSGREANGDVSDSGLPATHAQRHPEELKASEPSTQVAGRSGQRELRIPNRLNYGPSVVMFSGFNFVG